MSYVNRERERVIPIKLNKYINSLSIESTSTNDIFTYINKDNVLEYTLESLELDMNKYNRLITNGIRDNDRFILESINFLNNASLEEGNIFSKLIQGAKKVIKIIIDKIVQFFKWIGSLIMKFVNWVKGLFNKVSQNKTAEKSQKVKQILLHGKEWIIKNASFEIMIYDWANINNLRGPFDDIFQRQEKEISLKLKRQREIGFDLQEYTKKVQDEIKSIDPNLDYQKVESIYFNQNRSSVNRENFANLEKLFGKGKIQSIVLGMHHKQDLDMQDHFGILDDAYGDLFRTLEIDIEAIEDAKGNYIIEHLSRKIALLFFNHIKASDSIEPQSRKFTKENLDKFLSKENIDFFNDYPKWLNWIKERVSANKNAMIPLTQSCQSCLKQIEYLRKAYDEFLVKFEKWDATQGHLFGKSHVLDTERAARDRNNRSK